MAKIDFRDSAWTSGIQIPDRLISSALQNGEEGYDALQDYPIEEEKK